MKFLFNGTIPQNYKFDHEIKFFQNLFLFFTLHSAGFFPGVNGKYVKQTIAINKSEMNNEI